jgi:serine/threonine protein kinase
MLFDSAPSLTMNPIPWFSCVSLLFVVLARACATVMEQVNGYDTKADIWSLGITALELAKGYAPYARYPPMKVLILTIQEDPPSLDTYDQLEMVDDMDDNQVMEDYSRAFGQFIDSCLQKNPSRRLSCNELLASKLLSPMADETVRQERREALRRQVCDVCPDVGTVAIGPQSSQQQPGHVPISILLNTAKDRQPGTSWVFPDGSQIFASSVTNAASSDEVMTQLEEFAAQTGGENYQRNQVGTDQTATSCDLGVSVVPGTNVVNERAAEDDTDDDDDDLDEFMTQFEQSTGGENFQRPPHSTQ